MLQSILVVTPSKSEATYLLQGLGSYRVVITHSAKEAFFQLDTRRSFSIVIIDLDLEQKQWVALLRLIRSDSRFLHLHLILLSRAEEEQKEISALRLGATDYFRRPYTHHTLQTRITMHLESMEQHRLEERIRTQDVLFNAIFWQAPIGITISERRQGGEGIDELYNVNPVFEKFTGRSKEELLKLGWSKITHPEDLKREMIYFNKLKEGKITSYEIQKRYVRPDGSIVWAHVTVAPIKVSDQNISHICLIQDITERKELEKSLAESERSKAVLLGHLPGMAYRCKYEQQWTMEFVSEGCYELTGYRPGDLINNRLLSYNSLIATEYRQMVWEHWTTQLQHHHTAKLEYEIITKDAQRKWVLEMGQGTYDEKGKVSALEGIVFDITDTKKAQQQLVYHLEHDIITDLPNYRSLEKYLQGCLTSSLDQRALVSVNLSMTHMLSLRHGLHYSQSIIRKVASLLASLATDKALLFSSFENRFAFCLTNYGTTEQLEAFCQQIIKTIGTTLSLEMIEWGLGVLEFGQQKKQTVEQLLRNLLIASEQSIESYEKEPFICFFDDSMRKRVDRQESISQEFSQIAKGIDTDRLFVQYQPILEAKTQTIACFEALARFKSPSLGLISPLEFIPILEKSKLIIPIGEMIIQQALNFVHKIDALGFTSVCVSINISAIQLLETTFVPSLHRLIKESGIDARRVIVEITETGMASSFPKVNEILGRIKDIGVRIALDDFGTGYSSFARVRELKINFLKIDKLFIDKLLVLKPEESITKDIISMAHSLGHLVVAEGVEEVAQKEYLLNYQCDMMQGYLFSKPVDEDQALRLLHTQ